MPVRKLSVVHLEHLFFRRLLLGNHASQKAYIHIIFILVLGWRVTFCRFGRAFWVQPVFSRRMPPIANIIAQAPGGDRQIYK